MPITDEDRRKLGMLAKLTKSSSNEELSKPKIERNGLRLSERESRALHRLAVETTTFEAAEIFGVSERTVERHKAYWENGGDARKWMNRDLGGVDDRLCGAMRCAAHDGDSLGEIAERHGLAKGTVHNHISVSSNQPCSHMVEVSVPRVEF